MADMKPIGIDQTTGQQRAVESADSLTNNVGAQIDRVRVPFTAKLAVVGTIPFDGSLPQITEGQFVVQAVITPKKIGNKFVVRAHICWSGLNNSNMYCAALFEAGSLDAIGATPHRRGTGGGNTMQIPFYVEAEYTAVALAALTFSVRFGPSSAGGAPFINADSDGSHDQIFGAAISTFIEVQEYSS